MEIAFEPKNLGGKNRTGKSRPIPSVNPIAAVRLTSGKHFVLRQAGELCMIAPTTILERGTS
jgi:hypothetical protein